MRHVLITLLILLGACREEAVEIPEPVRLTSEATSHFCMMNLAEHGGPKAQVHLEGFPAPIFFAQVRDSLAYLRGPEREAHVLATYVSDMGVAPSWDAPGDDNWIRATDAVFVVGANVVGGMGAPEIVPFSSRKAAEDFATLHAAKVLELDQIPAEAVLGPVELVIPGEERP